jgi:hypothetical protein
MLLEAAHAGADHPGRRTGLAAGALPGGLATSHRLANAPARGPEGRMAPPPMLVSVTPDS